MRIAGRTFDQNHTFVMGILNVTPDSFSDGGRYDRTDRALYQAQKMIEEGADVIDIGGESTRPGYRPVSAEEEADRVLPVIEAVHARFDVPLSVDTQKSTVAQAALAAGASLVNDIWGLMGDQKMADLIAQSGASCCLMHNRKPVDASEDGKEADPFGYQNFMEDLLFDLKKSLGLADAAGIDRERILLDPGIGFAKSYEQNLLAIQQVRRVVELGCDVLLAASRKSVIGLTLGTDVHDRLSGTLATTVYAVWAGCRFVRVHDVKENVQAIRMTEAILGR